MANLSRYERETIILFNEDEKEARVYTCSPALMRKMDELCKNNPEFRTEKQDDISRTYVCPKRLVSIRKPPRLSGEQRQKAAERLRGGLRK